MLHKNLSKDSFAFSDYKNTSERSKLFTKKLHHPKILAVMVFHMFLVEEKSTLPVLNNVLCL